MAAESAGEVQVQLDLGKTMITAKVKELQEECLEIRKNSSGKYE